MSSSFRLSSFSTATEQDPRSDIVRVLRSEHRGREHGGPDDSALDTGSVDGVSIDLPGLVSERRRSSRLSIRPTAVTNDLPDKTDASGLGVPYAAERARRRSDVARVQTIDEAPAKAKDADLGTDIPMYDLTPVPSVLTPSVRSAGEVEYSRKYVRNGWIHFAALCWCFFLQGWNDGTTGPLIPAIQEHYHVGFAVVSLIFVTNCIGYLSGAFANVILNDKLGFGKVVVLGSVCQIVTYAIQAPAPPFPVLVCAYAIAGFGISLQNAQANGFVGSLKDHVAAKLCILHGSYGVGAFAAPLVATHFSQTRHWSFHFLISIGIALTNTIVLTSVFRLKTQDEVMAEAGHGPGEVGGSAQSNLYREILGLKALHFMAIFSLIYVGVEVTLGGWIVTYIIQKRHGGPSSGYISSGFFGGLTVGRIALIWINRKVGERRIIFIYAALAIGLEVTIWLVPNLYENAVAVSFIGLLLGPMYPILVDHATKILPRWLLTGCVGWIAGFGQAGSAVLPFITGVLSAKYGIGSLQPFMVAMMATMIGLWAVVPKAQRRVD